MYTKDKHSLTAKDLYNFHKEMQSKNWTLLYKGLFTQDITKSVLKIAERKLEIYNEDASVKKKVFNIMVECLQNICKHADKHDDFDPNELSIFMIGKDGKDYTITTGNPIKTEKVESLRSTLTELNDLEGDALKSLFKEVIKNRNTQNNEISGLGLIDMARKSGKKFDFHFKDLDNNISFFILQTRVAQINL